ncbi:PASTA domain-containing protein [Phytoactinopolyspora mesophila]|uniref:non-specific serine/threonine protein kinase n=1 Tax=Phytoactinopolyspora mesophila TaxID=2650750 RepID=A0A7K3M4H8_9ACTN|nr:PASTA domain-containing protein [Phytoactinopolyspora mesophila]
MDLSVSDAPVGRLLDRRYRVESLLARGGMATVYRGTDTRLDRVVALKVMHAELAADDEFVSRFISEARSVARLSDPHIVSVFDQGEDEGAVFLAMEFVKGRTLRDVLREYRRLDADLCLEIYEAVLSALRAAHDADIVHRDVKPENVLISDDGRVKVTDFGLARATRSQGNTTARGLLLGTVNYISPEQALGERATPRSDVYAAGVMLFELLTGRPPHSGPTDFVIVRAHIDEDVPPPSEVVSDVPPAVDDLVRTATARRPELRYADAGSFLAAVRLARAAIASGEAPGARHASQTPPALMSDPQGVQVPPPPPAAGHAAGDTADDDPAAGAIELADSFYHGYDAAAPGAAEPAAAGDETNASNPLDVATAFYHEAPALPPPPPPPNPNRTRVISTQPDTSHAGQSAENSGTDVSTGHAGAGRAGRRTQAQQRRRWRGPVMFILVLVLAAAVTVGAWWFGAGRWTSTPSLLNLEPDAAMTVAEEAGLSATADGEGFSERVEAGLVLQTEPGPGEQILRGGTIRLIISQGPERYEVPDVQGMTREQAETALTDRNLIPDFTERHHGEVEEGRVISQDIDAGDEVRPETEVSVAISLGPEPIDITDFTGQPAEDAREALADAGFNVDVDEEHSESVAPGVVISQDPPSGTGFENDTISLVVSKGPEVVEVEVPSVVGERVREAAKILEDAGFEYQVEPDFGDGGRLRRQRVLSQSPEPGSRVPEGSTVTLYIIQF